MKSLRQLRRISVTTTPEAEDAVTELLSAILNLPASTYYDIESGVSTVTVYLQRKSHLSHKILAAISAGLKRIRSCGLKIGSGKIVMARVRRENWAESWKRHFKPIEIRFQNRRDLLCEPPSSRNKSGTRVTGPSEELGKSLLIKPSWSTRKTRKDQVIVVLDPGLSFGTGHHPTTAFCLNEIVRLQKNQDSVLRRLIAAVETVSKPDNNLLAPRGTSGERNEEGGIPSKNAPPRPDPLLHCMEEREKAALSRSPETRSANRPCLKSSSLSFLDLGTGSGILAIAGVKLGYSPVSAMDFDPEAVRVARANARVNHVGQKLKIRRGDVTKLPLRPRRQYDLVCANLISNLLITERRRIVAQLNRTGTLVLAGILKPEFKEVQKAYKTLGLRPISRRDEKEWCSGSFCFGR